jgi:hypothetical protein
MLGAKNYIVLVRTRQNSNSRQDSGELEFSSGLGRTIVLAHSGELEFSSGLGRTIVLARTRQNSSSRKDSGELEFSSGLGRTTYSSRTLGRTRVLVRTREQRNKLKWPSGLREKNVSYGKRVSLFRLSNIIHFYLFGSVVRAHKR